MIPRLVITPGEPAGIGPDLMVAAAREDWPFQIVAVADPELLQDRARRLHLPLELCEYDPDRPRRPHAAGTLDVLPVPMEHPAPCGELSPANAGYVIRTLDRAIDGCLDGEFDGLVTGPVHKGVINEAGIPFTGHTERLGERTGGHPVMMLAAGDLRVSLATTHIPVRAIADAITRERLNDILTTLHRDLGRFFGLESPRILVCGLNPHAGEGGHLGREEIEVIEPLLDELRGQGMDLIGPLPADTLFTPQNLERGDAVLAMYHDQGLPVLKHVGFGRAVNITLGLPIVRTSVDHGTALDLAGTGRADVGSLHEALRTAAQMATHREQG